MRSLFGSCFAVFLLACGGSVGSSSDPGGTSTPNSSNPSRPRDDSPNQTTPRALGVEGSYDVSFAVVNASGGNVPGSAPQPPSRTTGSRLDLKRDASGKLLGAMAGRWGEVSAVEVTEKPEALELVGSTSIDNAVSSASGVSDTWKTWRLPRNADGTLKGTFDASGEETFGEGDVMYQSTLGGSGTFAPDQTHPETRMRAFSQLAPEGKILPWDLIELDLAEPIERAAAVKAAQLAGDKGATLAMSWTDAGAHVTDWAGVSSVSGHAAKWPNETTWSGNVGVVVDRVNLGSVASSSPIEFITLGPKTADVEFDDDIVFPTFWGATTLLGGGFSGGTDAHCEAGGCLRLDSPPVNSCDASTRVGMATRLTRGATGKVSVRYRVLAHPTIARPSGPNVPALTTVQLATEGGAVKDSVLPAGTSSPGSVAFVKLTTPIDQFEWATPWSTFEMDAPAGSGDLGVAIGTRGSPYCGGPPYPEVDITVLIENVKSL